MAKILGQLESAQLENLTGNPANHPTGRMYMDITAPAAAIPKVYDGTNWRTLAFSPSTAFVTQNSGKAVTVNWANGLNQQIILTDNAVISFSNPQEGQLHTLLVTQALRGANSSVLSTWMYVFNMPDQDVTRDRGAYQPKPLPLGNDKIHQWIYHSASIAAYTTAPGTWSQMGATIVTTATPSAVDIPRFYPNYFAVATTTTPFSNAYPLYEFLDGYGNPFSQSQTLSTATAAALLDGVYSPNGQYWGAASGTSPFLQVFNIIFAGPAGGVFANPATLPAGAAKALDWHPSSAWVLVGHTTTPFMSAYPIQNGAFGTKIADPATLPTAQVNAVRWSPHGDFVAISSNSSPFIEVYPWTISTAGVATFGAKVNDPAILPNGTVVGQNHHQIAWRPQGDFIVMTEASTPWVYLIPFNRATASFGAAITFPALSGGASATSVEWTPDGQYLIVGANTTPFCYVYDMSTGTPVLVALDVAAPATGCMGMTMHPSGEWGIWATSSSPKIAMFIPPNKQRNYVRLI